MTRETISGIAAVLIVATMTTVQILSVPVLAGQQPPSPIATSALAFEIAAIRPSPRDALLRPGGRLDPGGRFTMTNVTIVEALGSAYRLQDFQIVGGPQWLNADRFDIVATAGRPVTAVQLSAMLRAFLVERLTLVAHSETRRRPVYALVMANRDGKLGPHVAPTSCVSSTTAPTFTLPTPDKRSPPCGVARFGPGHIDAQGQTMSQLSVALSPYLSGLVVDRTNLSGAFDFQLDWSPLPGEQLQFQSARPNLSEGARDLGPTLFTALQEQLALRLDAETGPVDVLVIDSVEKPAPD